MRYSSVEEVTHAYEAGLMGLAEMPAYIMDLVDEQTVDQVVAAIPDRYRGFFLEWAADNYLGGDTISIGGEHAQPLPERSLAAIRGWFRRNPTRSDGR